MDSFWCQTDGGAAAQHCEYTKTPDPYNLKEQTPCENLDLKNCMRKKTGGGPGRPVEASPKHLQAPQTRHCKGPSPGTKGTRPCLEAGMSQTSEV